MTQLSRDQEFIGFWHPFGPHGGETREEIITRKRREIKENDGWTLWSFQHRTEEALGEWRRQIGGNNQVFVFCSDSKGTADPKGTRGNARQFKGLPSEGWDNIPSTIKIPHPFGKKEYGCAFKVVNINTPGAFEDMTGRGMSWLRLRDKSWRDNDLPTRGEYLIKSGGKSKLRSVCLILELGFPYVVTIKK